MLSAVSQPTINSGKFTVLGWQHVTSKAECTFHSGVLFRAFKHDQKPRLTLTTTNLLFLTVFGLHFIACVLAEQLPVICSFMFFISSTHILQQDFWCIPLLSQSFIVPVSIFCKCVVLHWIWGLYTEGEQL